MTASPVLQAATRLLITLLLLLGLFLLVRGHNEPGGGFAAGLVVAIALAILALAQGPQASRALLRADPRRLIAAGLAIALASGLGGWIGGDPFLTGHWTELVIGEATVKLGTPLLFDVGVALLVVGVAATAIFWFAEEA